MASNVAAAAAAPNSHPTKTRPNGTNNRRASFKPSEQTYSVGGTPMRAEGGPPTQQAQQKVQALGKQVGSSVTDAKKKASKQAKKVKAKIEKPSHAVLNTFILVVVSLSLLSLRFCPPSARANSSLSAYTPTNVYNRLTAPNVPAWERFVCYPTNAYRHHILEPYIVPHVKARLDELADNPVVRDHIVPAYKQVESRFQPLVRRAQAFNKKFVSPRVPVIRRNFNHLRTTIRRRATPLVKRAEATAKIQLHRVKVLMDPYVSRARNAIAPYTYQATLYHHMGIRKSRQFQQAVKDAYSHPVSQQIKKHSIDTYTKARPIADAAGRKLHRHGKKAYHYGKTDFLPNVLRGADRLVNNVEQLAIEAWNYIVKLYRQHLGPHIDPHVKTVNQQFYQPYLKHHVEHLTPLIGSLVAAPSYTHLRSGFKNTADRLQNLPNQLSETVSKVIPSVSAHSVAESATPDPSSGGVAAAAKDAFVEKAEAVLDAAQAVFSTGQSTEHNDEDDLSSLFEEDLPSEIRPSKAPLTADSESPEQKADRKAKEREDAERTRREIDHTFEVLEKRIEVAGENQRKHIASKKSLNAAQKEMDRTCKAFERYIGKFDLNKANLEQAQVDATATKIREATVKGQTRIASVKSDLQKDIAQGLFAKDVVEQGNDMINDAMETVERSYVSDHAELAHKLTWFSKVTHKDWKRYQDIEKAAQSLRQSYQAILADCLRDIQAIETESKKEVSALSDTYQDRIAAKSADALEQLGQGGFRILPIAKDGLEYAQSVGSDVIGKTKEQVQQALGQLPQEYFKAQPIVEKLPQQAQDVIGKGKEQIEQALSSLLPSSTQTADDQGILARAKDQLSILPIPTGGLPELQGALADALGKSREQVLEAFEQAGIVVESAQSKASEAGASAQSAASSVSAAIASPASTLSEAVAGSLHQATRSASSLVGATPSPEGVQEHLSGLSNEASSRLSNAAEAGVSAMSAVSKSVMSAVGAKPTAESLKEQIQEFAADVSAMGSEFAETASSSIHSATRSLVNAVGATPTPESMDEHVEALLNGMGQYREVVNEKVRQGASSVSEVAGQATQVVKNAIRNEL